MRYFRRLPPQLRAFSVAGLLLPLAGIALLVPMLFARSLALPPALADYARIPGLALNLMIIGGGLTLVVNGYTTRFHVTEGALYPFATWRSQARTAALLALLPLCALLLMYAAPAASPAFHAAPTVTILGAIVLVIAYQYTGRGKAVRKASAAGE